MDAKELKEDYFDNASLPFWYSQIMQHGFRQCETAFNKCLIVEMTISASCMHVEDRY